DAVCIVGTLPEPFENQALFAVFDGHGGSQVSHIASKEFPKVLTACANKISSGGGSCSSSPGRQAASDCHDGDKEDKEDKDCHSEASPSGAAGAPEQDWEEEFSTPRGDPKSASADVCSIDSIEAHHLTGSAAKVQGNLPSRSLAMTMIAMDAFLRRLGSGLATNAAAGGKIAQQNGPLGVMARHLEASDHQKNAFNLVGSTAIVVLIDCGGPDGDPSEPCEEGASEKKSSGRPRSLTVANCGDSRALLCRAGKVVELSEDHKPELESEELRIRKAGGCVKMIGPCHRIDGWGLNLSRALGDFHYKARADLPVDQQKVIAVPEIRTLQLNDEDEFLVLGCDGCFELHTSQNVIDIVRKALQSGMTLQQAAEELVDRSCSPNLMKTRGKGGDNCSCIIIRLPK
ncbi:unnamed protein product, partial [Polarella glacialis]